MTSKEKNRGGPKTESQRVMTYHIFGSEGNRDNQRTSQGSTRNKEV